MVGQTFGDPEIQRKCGGVCCKRFYLPFLPPVFNEDYQKYLRGEETRFHDIGTLGPMLKFIEPAETSGGFYTCNYLDDVSGLCLIYKHRPHMCWAYPYGGKCNFHACSDKPFMRRFILTRPLWVIYDRLLSRYKTWRTIREVVAKMPSTWDDKLVELKTVKLPVIPDGVKLTPLSELVDVQPMSESK